MKELPGFDDLITRLHFVRNVVDHMRTETLAAGETEQNSELCEAISSLNDAIRHVERARYGIFD